MFNVFDDPPKTVIKPESDIISEAPEKLRVLLTELINKGCRKLKFDLSLVKNADASAVAVFAILPNTLSAKFSDSELEIVFANQDMSNMFKMTGLHKQYRMI